MFLKITLFFFCFLKENLVFISVWICWGCFGAQKKKKACAYGACVSNLFFLKLCKSDSKYCAVLVSSKQWALRVLQADRCNTCRLLKTPPQGRFFSTITTLKVHKSKSRGGERHRHPYKHQIGSCTLTGPSRVCSFAYLQYCKKRKSLRGSSSRVKQSCKDGLKSSLSAEMRCFQHATVG